MRLNTNLHSLSVFQNYKKNLGLQSSALGKISSGNKINSAKDDPNGLGKSETLRMQIKGLQSSQRNLQDSVSMMQTFDSGLEVVNNSLQRIRELTVQAGSGSLSESDRAIIQAEIDEMKANIDTTVKNTEFNGVNLIGNEDVVNNNYPETIKTTIGANVGESMSIPVLNLSTSLLGTQGGMKVSQIDVTNFDNIDDSLNALDDALKQVNNARSKYGAISNRMESTAQGMDSVIETTTSAYSSVKDADIAKEMLEYARTSILIESATAMMVQTNKLPSEALSILERVK